MCWLIIWFIEKESAADNVYKIKNFVKHQNIKVEEKVIENLENDINKKKRNKTSTKNKKGINDIEMLEEESLITIYDGFDVMPSVEGDKVVASWACCT